MCNCEYCKLNNLPDQKFSIEQTVLWTKRNDRHIIKNVIWGQPHGRKEWFYQTDKYTFGIWESELKE